MGSQFLVNFARNGAKVSGQLRVRGNTAEADELDEMLKAASAAAQNSFRYVKKVALNSDDLAKMAMDYRKTENLWHDGNIVVLEYLDNNGQMRHLVQSTVEGSGKHSERLAIEALESQGIPLGNVKKIYSELEICQLNSGGMGPGGCKKMIIDKIGNQIDVKYSYDYPGTDITTKPLRDASINQRRIDFNQFK